MRNQILFMMLACGTLFAANEVAGIQWKAPAQWKALPDRPMRAGTYTVPAAAGDSEPGEMAIFYFGQGQGGGVEANVKRWVSQFQAKTDPDKRSTQKINGFSVTTVELAGTYLFSPSPGSPDKTPKPGYRMIGVIVEAPEGNVFFKLTGPVKTVKASRPMFDKMLASLKK